jgi:hypothetical protein
MRNRIDPVPPHHLSIKTQADWQTSRGASANHSRDRCAKPDGYPSLTGAISIGRGMMPRLSKASDTFRKSQEITPTENHIS